MNSRFGVLIVCSICGKRRGKLNTTNWSRHLEKCKNKKMKNSGGRNCDISKLFALYAIKSTTNIGNYVIYCNIIVYYCSFIFYKLFILI